jgi:predicted alpha/beta-fold hydrolase
MATERVVDAREYAPPRWLRNPHLQSVLASSGLRRGLARRRRSTLAARSAAHVLDCGDGVRLHGYHTPHEDARGLVVLLHGWEGSADSIYVTETAARLHAEGFAVFRLNFRDHGDTHALNRGLFHSCRIGEVVGAVAAIQHRFRPDWLALAGFSLGGNFALRVALRAPQAGIRLAHALAVCPVVSPASGLFGIESGPWFYQRHFLRKWRRSLRRKRAAFPDAEWFAADEYAGDLRGLTRALVARHTAFGSLEAYLEGYSIAGEALAALAVPATILTAADDPIIPVADFRTLELPPNAHLDIVAHGGHCGFLTGASLRSFTDDYIASRMRAQRDGAAAPAHGDAAEAGGGLRHNSASLPTEPPSG